MRRMKKIRACPLTSTVCLASLWYPTVRYSLSISCPAQGHEHLLAGRWQMAGQRAIANGRP